MELKVTMAGPELAEPNLVDFEKMTGRPIPAGYRDFLLAHNGGAPRPRNFTVSVDGDDNSVAIGYLLGIGTDEETWNIDNVLDAYSDRLTPAFYPIACDPGGNIIGIATEGPSAGAVFYCDLEREEDDGVMPLERMFPIAASFAEFIEGLTQGD